MSRQLSKSSTCDMSVVSVDGIGWVQVPPLEPLSVNWYQPDLVSERSIDLSVQYTGLGLTRILSGSEDIFRCLVAKE